MLEIAHEARLVNGTDGTQSHRPGRKLPKLRHQPRMRTGAQSLAAHFLAIVVELLLVQAAFQESARVHARSGMRLEVNKIRAAVGLSAAEEMIKANLKDLGGRGITGNMAAKITVGLVGSNNHGQ